MLNGHVPSNTKLGARRVALEALVHSMEHHKGHHESCTSEQSARKMHSRLPGSYKRSAGSRVCNTSHSTRQADESGHTLSNVLPTTATPSLSPLHLMRLLLAMPRCTGCPISFSRDRRGL